MAYVKTDWENLPSTDTPITDTALDNMENGIEYNDQRLNGTKPMGSIVVDDVSCKNIANLINFTQTSGQSSTYLDFGTVYLEAGTYTLSWTQSAAMTSNTRNTPGYTGAATAWQTQNTNVNMSAGRSSWTFTIDNAGIYTFRWWINTPSTTVNMTDFMLEKGNEVTSYTPFKSFGEDIYSTNEIEIGTWLGKPLYRRAIDTTLTTGAPISNIANIRIKHIYGIVKRGTQEWNINTIYPNDSSICCTTFYDETSGDLFAVYGTGFTSGSSISVVLEYTKETD